MHWCLEKDAFGFQINLKDKPNTRRGLLSCISSIYDSLGIAAPFLLQAKRILQQFCNDLFEAKHPIILPKRSKTTEAIIRNVHENLQHAGRYATLCQLRERGFWVFNGNALVRHILYKCVRCRILRGKTEVQRMADLPGDRLQATPPGPTVNIRAKKNVGEVES